MSPPSPRQRFRRRGLAAAVLCLLGSASALGAPAGGSDALRAVAAVGCHLLDCFGPTGAIVSVSSVTAHVRRGSTVTVCADAHCVRQPARGLRYAYATSGVKGSGPIRVRFILRDRHGRVRLRLDRTVRRLPQYPNGTACPPTCWTRSLRVDARRHRLVLE